MKFEFVETYNKEVTTERKENLINELAKIESPEGKISYLKNELYKYLQNITPEILDVSGTTVARHGGSPGALFWDRYLQLEIEKINDVSGKVHQPKTKTVKIKAPALGLFCNLINEIGNDKRKEGENATVYCRRICNKFKLPYTDRVRQNYNVNQTKRLRQELTEKVLPLIDYEIKALIEKYFDSKQLPKQKLYA